MKICTCCLIEKELTEFYKKKSSKDGYRSICKKCNKEYYTKNYLEIKKYRDERYLKLKDSDEFKEKRRNYYLNNKENVSLKSKEYNTLNKEKISKNKKDYYNNNKEEILEKQKNYYEYSKIDENFVIKKRLKDKINTKKWRNKNKKLISQRIKDKKQNDILYRLSDSIRTLIWNSIRKMGFDKNSKTNIILGCTFEDFKIEIESKFQDGMTWENYGKWHLDHKIPISWANNEDEVYKLNHYTNFQPLWAKDNLIKGNKWSD